MRRPRRNRPVVFALYANAGLLLVVVMILLKGSGSSALLPAAYGAPLSPQPIAGGANLYIMPAQFSPQTWGCYIMDIDAQTLCAYRYFPSATGDALRLVAARKIAYDRKLANFNSDKPSWNEVKQWVEQASEPLRGTERTPNPNSNTTEKSPTDHHE
jgi:hypothetical protein